MPQRVLALDLDGTLLDSERDLALSVNHTLVTLGLPVRTDAEIKSFIGNGVTVLLTKALDQVTPALLSDAKEIFFAHYRDHLLDNSCLYDGWTGVLESDIPLALATNKPERFARAILAGLGLLPRFGALIGGDSLPVRKPDVGVADHLAQTLRIPCSRLIMVGDGIPDGQLAAAAGIPFWAATWGYSTRDELAPWATLYLESPKDILNAWDRLGKGA